MIDGVASTLDIYYMNIIILGTQITVTSYFYARESIFETMACK